MTFTLAAADRDQLAKIQSDVVLAIIMDDGVIHIRIADARDYPGHLEWIRRDGIKRGNVLAGFSMIVESGLVSGLFPYSRLNRTDPPRLSDDQIGVVESLIPLAPNYKVYR